MIFYSTQKNNLNSVIYKQISPPLVFSSLGAVKFYKNYNEKSLDYQKKLELIRKELIDKAIARGCKMIRENPEKYQEIKFDLGEPNYESPAYIQYLTDKTKKLLKEIETETLKINQYEKYGFSTTLRN